MSEKKQRQFCGNGVQKNEFYTDVTLKKSQVDQHWFEYNGEEYLRLTVGKNREVTQYGKTHSVWINDYKPENKEASSAPAQAVSAGDGLPF